MASKVTEEYGSLVFSDSVMRDRLPKPTYKELSRVIKEGKALNLDIANEVAHAMKEWALEKGATHYTHWFQPLSGITSEKHDSLPGAQRTTARAITRRSTGKNAHPGRARCLELPQLAACVLPSRPVATPLGTPLAPPLSRTMSCASPRLSCSYTGEALDKKTPLLRSMTVALDVQSKRVLALFGKDPQDGRLPSVGDEQEYFLIKKDAYAASVKDLVMYRPHPLSAAAPVQGSGARGALLWRYPPHRHRAYMKELGR